MKPKVTPTPSPALAPVVNSSPPPRLGIVLGFGWPVAKVALDALAALPESDTCGLPSPVVDEEIIVFLSDDEMIVAIVVAVVAGEVLNPTKTIDQVC